MTFSGTMCDLFDKKTHFLSGIALLVDNDICLVLPRKFRNKKRYSIPKGHIEYGSNPLNNALSELKEETGIILRNNVLNTSFQYEY